MNADAIDALLPQHQCQRCGYAGCRPYAEAIAGGDAGINRCPPGGQRIIDELSRLTGLPPQAPAPDVEAPGPAQVARIDPAACIGCTKCLPACPVDAIVGAGKRLHDVIAAACTGCGLCIPPCPVDCITLHSVESGDEARLRLDPPPHRLEAERRRFQLRAGELRERYARHDARLAESRRRRRRRLDSADAEDRAARRKEIEAAVARVRARRRQRQ